MRRPILTYSAETRIEIVETKRQTEVPDEDVNENNKEDEKK